MKKVFKKLALSAMAVTLAATIIPGASISAASKNPASTRGGVVIINSYPDDGASFTLVGEQNKNFDNTMTNSVISAGVAAALTWAATATGIAETVPYKTTATIGAITGWLGSKLSDNNKVYTTVRLGISYNSYLGYYEYVDSVIYFNNEWHDHVTEVYYSQTGTRVADDVLARYNLRNP